MLKRIKYYFKRIYRLSLNHKKKEEIFWKDLKKLHADVEWPSGVYEKEKYIETAFGIGDDRAEFFYYMVYDGYFHCRVKVLDAYPVELTTELFILAAHFNNIMNYGVVVVNVDSGFVEYHLKNNLLLPLLYHGEIYNQIITHYDISKEIYFAFQRLVVEGEAPAIIIADLLRKIDDDSKE